MTRKLLLAVALLATAFLVTAQERPAPTPKNPPLFKGDKPKKDDGTRTLRGVVRDPGDNPVESAVVKVKDTKTLTIRSFITKADGSYIFNGLSVNIDYEVMAETRDGSASGTKTLSVYNTTKEPVINLKVEPKKTESRN
jgi:hypothetical protein